MDILDKLERAVRWNELTTVLSILKTYPELVDGRTSGRSLLQVAVDYQHHELVKVLIKEFGAKTNLGDENILESTYKFPRMMEVLLEYGVDINAYGSRSGKAPIHHALRRAGWGGTLDELVFLIEHGADVNLPEDNGDGVLTELFTPRSVFDPIHSRKAKVIIFMIRKGTRTNLLGYSKFVISSHLEYALLCLYDLKLVLVSTKLPGIREESTFPEISPAVLRRVCDFV